MQSFVRPVFLPQAQAEICVSFVFWERIYILDIVVKEDVVRMS
jgi:hypothetical protein